MTELSELTYCKTHPTVETGLRCSKCEDYICTRCAIQSPVGYRCKSCIKGQQAVFNTAETRDYIVGALVAMSIGAAAAAINIFPASFGFFGWIIAFMFGGAAGRFGADMVRRAIQRRRSKNLFLVVAILGTLATLPLILFSDLGGFIFAFAFGTTIYSSLRGISIRR